MREKPATTVSNSNPVSRIPQPGLAAAGGGECATASGLYAACLDEADQAALARALGAGLDEETALLRVLIRRALLEGQPATQVAYLVNSLASLLKTRHVLAGKVGKQLDEAITAALDAIAAESGVMSHE